MSGMIYHPLIILLLSVLTIPNNLFIFRYAFSKQCCSACLCGSGAWMRHVWNTLWCYVVQMKWKKPKQKRKFKCSSWALGWWFIYLHVVDSEAEAVWCMVWWRLWTLIIFKFESHFHNLCWPLVGIWLLWDSLHSSVKLG